MKINHKYIQKNHNKGRGGQKIKYIVIHDTGNNGGSANANAHFNYFDTVNRKASAHYFVDQTQILQIVRDEDTAWHVGDGKGKYGITNQNSIGIEICINDGDYVKEINDTKELTLYLMDKYNIPLDRVVRHYDASRKNCPRIMNEGTWNKWNDFKVSLVNQPSKPIQSSKPEPSKVKVRYKNKVHSVDGYMKDNKNYVQIRETFEALGFQVDWDNQNREVLIK